MKKKIFSMFLSLCLCMNLFGVVSHAQVGSGNFTYEVYDDHVEVKKYTNLFMTALEIPELIEGKPVTKIQSSAFFATHLQNVTLPKTLESISSMAFYDCYSIKAVHITDYDAWCRISFGSDKANPLHCGGTLYVNGKAMTDFVWPEDITTIGKNAFYSADGVNSITIPPTVTKIGTDAFYDCKKLQAVYLSDLAAWCNVEFSTAYSNPMANTSAKLYVNGEEITRLRIPDGVKTISSHAFCNNKHITEVVIPESVTKIKTDAFGGCSNIDYVYYEGTQEQWENVTIGSDNYNFTSAKVLYNASEKTYNFETYSAEKVPPVTGYYVPSAPELTDADKVFIGWYDNAAFAGEQITFPYYGASTTLYAKWREKDGTSFEEAIPTAMGGDYGVTTTSPDQVVYYKFRPTQTQDYRIYTTDGQGITAKIYNANQEEIGAANTEADGNVQVVYHLEAGKQYYFAVAGGAQADNFTFHVRKNLCTYQFISDEGYILMQNTVVFGTVLSGAPKGPEKDPTQQYTFTFESWDGYTQGMEITDDIIFKPIYTETLNSYTYVFMDENNKILVKETADYGTVIVPPAPPTKESTEKYFYEFIGWKGYEEGMTVTGNALFTPEFTEKVKQFTYRFVDGDTVVKEETVDYGTVITAPEAPQKAEDAQYTYTFSGWEGYADGFTVTGDVTFTATYIETIKQYTYKFMNEGTVVKEETVDYGTEITPPEDPTKPSTAKYSYIFSNWNGFVPGMTVTGNAIFFAHYTQTINQYTYKFVNDDGTVISEGTANYGTTIERPKEVPQKAEDVKYTYAFWRWGGYTSGMTLTEDVTFTAEYVANTKVYKYRFVVDGAVVKEESKMYGTVITPPANPEKAATAQYTYTFSHWEGWEEGMIVTEDVTFTAVFDETINHYTYQFVDEDGTVVASKTVEYGTVIVSPPQNFSKPATQQYTYTFAGWEGYTDGMRVTQDINFHIVYTATVNQYTYQFLDEAGNVVLEETADYGTVIAPPEGPVKPATQQYTYIFAGWEGFFGNNILTEDITFTPNYTSVVNRYTYKFVSDGNTLLEETVDYGTQIKAPENPTKEADVQYTYTFSHWDGFAENFVVTDHVTFVAVYDATLNQYTYRFLYEDGTVAHENTVDYGTVIQDAPTIPYDAYALTSCWAGYTEGYEVVGDADFPLTYTYEEYVITVDGTDICVPVKRGKHFYVPFEKTPTGFIGYYDGPNGTGNRITNKYGHSYLVYTLHSDLVLYSFSEPILNNGAMRLNGNREVLMDPTKSTKVYMETVLDRNWDALITQMDMTVRYDARLEMSFDAEPQQGKVRTTELSKAVADGFVEVTFRSQYTNCYVTSTIVPLRLWFTPTESMPEGSTQIQIVDYILYNSNGEATENRFTDVYSHCICYRKGIDPESIEIVGEDAIKTPTQYKVNLYPETTTNTSVAWSVDKTSVATIDQNGVLTPIKTGTVVITANSNANGIKATKQVEVVKHGIKSVTSEKGVWEDPYKIQNDAHTIYIDANATEFSLTPTFTDEEITVRFNGIDHWVSGETLTVPLEQDETIITADCILEDGTVYRTYTFKVVKYTGLYAWMEPTNRYDTHVLAGGAPDGTLIIIAYYSGTQMVSWTKKPYVEGGVKFHNVDVPFYTHAKILAWGTLEDIGPVLPVITFNYR